MNMYLYEIGSKIPEIRKILGLTQEQLSSLMGVSRPTIVKIEQDPSKLTKTMVIVLFSCVAMEWASRKQKVDLLDPHDYQRPEEINRLLQDVQAATAMSASQLTQTWVKGASNLAAGVAGAAGLSRIGGIAGIAGLAAGAAVAGPVVAALGGIGLLAARYLSQNKKQEKEEATVPPEGKWDEKGSELAIDLIKSRLQDDKKQLQELFGLEDLTLERFREKLEKNEI